MASWFVTNDGKEHGPFTSDQMKQFAATGQIQGETPVRREDKQTAIRASEIKGLFPFEPAPQSAPLPPPSIAPPQQYVQSPLSPIPLDGYNQHPYPSAPQQPYGSAFSQPFRPPYSQQPQYPISPHQAANYPNGYGQRPSSPPGLPVWLWVVLGGAASVMLCCCGGPMLSAILVPAKPPAPAAPSSPVTTRNELPDDTSTPLPSEETVPTDPKKQLADYIDIARDLNRLRARLDVAETERYREDDLNWRYFAHPWSSTNIEVRDRVFSLKSPKARLRIGGLIGPLNTRFQALAFRKATGTAESKSDYIRHWTEAKAFLQELQDQIDVANGHPTKPIDLSDSEDPGPILRVLEEEKRPTIKRSLTVLLRRRATAEELESMATKFKADDANTYEQTFISYLLPGMKLNEGAWATTHYSPNLDVEVLGVSREQELVFQNEVDDPSRSVIGKWLDDSIGEPGRLVLFIQDSQTMLEKTYSDGSKGTHRMTELPSKDGRKFEKTEGKSEQAYYFIGSDGHLQIWSTFESPKLLSTAWKIESL